MTAESLSRCPVKNTTVLKGVPVKIGKVLIAEFMIGLFKISVSSFTSNICGIPGVEIWNPPKNWVPKCQLVNISG